MLYGCFALIAYNFWQKSTVAYSSFAPRFLHHTIFPWKMLCFALNRIEEYIPIFLLFWMVGMLCVCMQSKVKQNGGNRGNLIKNRHISIIALCYQAHTRYINIVCSEWLLYYMNLWKCENAEKKQRETQRTLSPISITSNINMHQIFFFRKEILHRWTSMWGICGCAVPYHIWIKDWQSSASWSADYRWFVIFTCSQCAQWKQALFSGNNLNILVFYSGQ